MVKGQHPYRPPIRECGKDEYLNIKNVSRGSMMATYRVPPQMMGIMPSNVGGCGDMEKAYNMFIRNELLPLQKELRKQRLDSILSILRFMNYTPFLAH